jgi:phage/plasmid-like protein (TIGR03299 family)
MAHELDLSNGRANFVSYKQPAWHGLGTVLQDVMTVEDALKHGGLAFHVEKRPNNHVIEWEGQEKIITSAESFFTFRTDTLSVLGDKLGKDYTVLQNTDALNILDTLVAQDCGISFESAGSLKGGKVVFVCCKMPEPIVVGANDITEQYLVMCNSHDGSMAVKVMFTPVRVVCQNTLTMAMSRAKKNHSIRHTSNVKENVNQAMKVLGIAHQNHDLAEQAFNELSKVKMNQQAFWNYVGNVFATPDERTKLRSGEPATKVISSIKQKAINGVLEFAEVGVGQQEAGAGTGWWAYNAVSGYASNLKAYSSAEKRFEYLTTDTGVLDRAFELAMNPSLIEPLTLSASGLVSGLSYN